MKNLRTVVLGVALCAAAGATPTGQFHLSYENYPNTLPGTTCTSTETHSVAYGEFNAVCYNSYGSIIGTAEAMYSRGTILGFISEFGTSDGGPDIYPDYVLSLHVAVSVSSTIYWKVVGGQGLGKADFVVYHSGDHASASYQFLTCEANWGCDDVPFSFNQVFPVVRSSYTVFHSRSYFQSDVYDVGLTAENLRDLAGNPVGGYLLTDVPEPSSYALWFTGLGALGLRRRFVPAIALS